MKKPYIVAIMCIWFEENMLPLALESSKGFVDEYVIMHKESDDNTKLILDKCIKKWNLKVKYIKSNLGLKEARMECIKQSPYADWYLIQDGDEVFYTEGKASIYHLLPFAEKNKLDGVKTEMIYLRILLTHTRKTLPNGKDGAKLISHFTFIKNGAVKSCSGAGDVPETKRLKARTFPHRMKFDCNVKSPLRIFLRTVQWSYQNVFHAWKTMTQKEYLMKHRKITTEEEFNKKAKEYYDAQFKYLKPYKEEEYCKYPSIIKKYIDAGYVRGYEGKIL